MDKLCVITGGAGGMGLATAKRVGQRVLISDLSEERLRAAAAQLDGMPCYAQVCDVTQRESVLRLAARARELGPVGSVIHTAGLSPQMAPARKIMEVNALGTIHVSEAFLPLASEGFCLVNTASMAGHLAPIAPSFCYKYALTDVDRFFAAMMFACNLVPARWRAAQAYTLSKHFTIWYSKAISRRFGERGARVLSVSPGTFDTAMGRLEEASGASAIAALGALRRVGRVEEIAELLAFCASEKAGYLTGTDILCDGGVVTNLRPRDMLQLAR